MVVDETGFQEVRDRIAAGESFAAVMLDLMDATGWGEVDARAFYDAERGVPVHADPLVDDA